MIATLLLQVLNPLQDVVTTPDIAEPLRLINWPETVALDSAVIVDAALSVLTPVALIAESALTLIAPCLTICELTKTPLATDAELTASLTICPEVTEADDTLIEALSFLTTTAPTDTLEDADTALAASLMVRPPEETAAVALTVEEPTSDKKPLTDVPDVAAIADAASSKSAVL